MAHIRHEITTMVIAGVGVTRPLLQSSFILPSSLSSQQQQQQQQHGSTASVSPWFAAHAGVEPPSPKPTVRASTVSLPEPEVDVTSRAAAQSSPGYDPLLSAFVLDVGLSLIHI